MTFNVFVSYSERDHIAAALVGTLRRANPNVRIFIAHQFRSPGLSIRQKVDLAIQQCHLFLLLWSERSESSEWVAYEIETAVHLGKDILPVLVENVDLPASIRDIEAVPLHQDSDRSMNWLVSHMNDRATAATQTGSCGFNWTALAKVGVAAAMGLATAWTRFGEKPKSLKKPPQARRKSRKKPRKTPS